MTKAGRRREGFCARRQYGGLLRLRSILREGFAIKKGRSIPASCFARRRLFKLSASGRTLFCERGIMVLLRFGMTTRLLLSYRLQSTAASTVGTNERLRQIYDHILRVDHAGEFAADRIYAGQLAVLGKTKSAPVIEHMWEQEKVHLATFKELIGKHRARPTVMLPIWGPLAYLLGAGTAMLGEKAAMACTVAVEDTIVKHYDNQIRKLMQEGDDATVHKELLDIIKRFRDEELEHHDTGLEHDAQKAPLYDALTEIIKVGCRGAIWISERI